ncbi:MAG: EAL domain-containing protein [Synergistaceae bacterium]
MVGKILIVDDEPINRKILRKILGDFHEVIEASDGAEALKIIKEDPDEIIAVMLDLQMPVMSGIEFLEERKVDDALLAIPVIITTQSSDIETEKKTLECGATDFVTKPYEPSIVKNRLTNIVRLRENAALKNTLERDILTKVYNQKTFYEKAEALLKKDKETYYDVISVDIEHFKLINDIFGAEEGDAFLVYVAKVLNEISQARGGFCGRDHSDNFSLIISSLDKDSSYEGELAEVVAEKLLEYPREINVVLSYGVYHICNRNIPVQIMYNYAEIALSSISALFDKHVAFYNNSIRDMLISNKTMEEEMLPALESGQFVTYYQPIYDLKKETIVSAEALVRWYHPHRGIITPDEFIPLFEKNGFITRLDLFMWEETCKEIKYLQSKGCPLPISVNVSRVDLFNPRLCSVISKLADKYEIAHELLKLEITESAYAENSTQLMETLECLKSHGFTISMDDFGSGYSSLNMLSMLPIDILKLDMNFVKGIDLEAVSQSSMISAIMGISRWMNLPVVAEGIETKEQSDFLESIGVLLGQGYYYSKPLTKKDFCEFVRKNYDFSKLHEENKKEEQIIEVPMAEIWDTKSVFSKMFDVYPGAIAVYELTKDSIFYLRGNKAYNENCVKFHFSDGLILGDLLQNIPDNDIESLKKGFAKLRETGEKFNYTFVRYSLDGKKAMPVSIDLRVINKQNGKTIVLGSLKYIEEERCNELSKVIKGKKQNNYKENNTCDENDKTEEYLKLIISSADCHLYEVNLTKDKVTPFLYNIESNFDEEVKNLSTLLKDTKYLDRQSSFMLAKCCERVVNGEKYGSEEVNMRFNEDEEYSWYNLTYMSQRDEKTSESIVTLIFSDISKYKRNEVMLYDKAKRDSLTTLLNRVSFEQEANKILKNKKGNEKLSFVLLDLDDFKRVNDKFGHLVGDEIIRKMASVLKKSIRSDEIAGRLGGDEFAILLTDIPTVEYVENKIKTISRHFAYECKKYKATCSIGFSLSDNESTFVSLYKAADENMYMSKNLIKEQNKSE